MGVVTSAHADAAELSAALDRMCDVPLDRLPDVGAERAKTLVQTVERHRLRAERTPPQT